MSSARRAKYTALLLIVLASGLALLAWTQTWFTLTLSGGSAAAQSLEVDGSGAAPAITALAFAGLALAGALAIAGVVFRIVLGLLEIVLGFCVGLSAVLAITDPAGASSSAVTAATGVAGHDSVEALVSASSQTFWPVVAIIAAVLMVAGGLAVVITARRWSVSGRRYQAVVLEPVDGVADAASAAPATAADSAVSDWDDLSRGSDPTA